MGVLTDIFAATDAQVDALSPDDIPIQMFPGVEAKGVHIIKLGTLQNILVGTDVQDAIGQHEWMDEKSAEGFWITRLPKELFDALAGLNGDQIPEVAHKWSETAEFESEHWEKSEVEDLMTRIVLLAKDARSNGKGLFVWTCL